MRATPESLSKLGIGVALGLVYLAFLGSWLSAPNLYPAGVLEGVVFGAILARLLAIIAANGPRRIPPATIVVLFGVEVFVVLASIGALVVTGDQAYSAFGRAFISAWIGSASVLLPPLAILLLLQSLKESRALSYSVPGAAALFSLLALATGTVSASDKVSGIGGLATELVWVARGQAQPAVQGAALAVIGAVAFASVLVYAGFSRRALASSDWLPLILLLAAGVLGVIGWTATTSAFLNPWLAFGLPVVGSAVLVWSSSRE